MRKKLLSGILSLAFLGTTFIFSPDPAAAATLFSTGLESGDTQPTWIDSVDWSSNVSGYFSTINPECSVRTGEQSHQGSAALMYSGTANGGAATHCYFKVFSVNIPVTSGTTLDYFIYPQQDNGRYVAVDFHCTDGTTLRDSGAVDQNGYSMHPAAGHGGSIPLNAWSEIRSDVGAWLSGKTIDKIWVAYDRAGSTGQFRGYIDDISITGTAGSSNNAFIASTVYGTDDVVVADYNAVDYGADPSGVKDSTAAIQNALNACFATGGGTVWLPAGTYRVTNTVNVPSFVTLRGDWRDPDSGSGSYGTLIRAEVASGDGGPVLFQIGGSAGVMGLTTYYPNQNATNPVHYNYTFSIPSGAFSGMPGTYMCSNIINCTMLNSYRGIAVDAIDKTQGHEVVTVRNVKGTVLYNGIAAYNSADVGTWENIYFNNAYWANAGSAYNAPSLSTLNAWTRANGVAFTIGDLEWEQFYNIRCSNYKYGINIVAGARASFCGEFLWADVQNTDIAVKVDSLDTRWGMSFLRSVLSGSAYSVQNNTAGYLKICDSTITGPTAGTVNITSPGTSPTTYGDGTCPKVTRAVLYNVTKAPYNVPYSLPGTSLPTQDATAGIQQALNDAGAAGGGVVYLPAGWYRINSHLTVPANVELRGCSSVPQRDQSDLSFGTVLLGYEGKNTSAPDTAAALVTLNGSNAGVRGLRFFYPENNPTNGIAPYPFAIRGNGANQYVANIGVTGVYNAVDFATNRCDNHYIRKVIGTIYNKGIAVGASSHGWVEGCLTNPNAVFRCSFGISGWCSGSSTFNNVLDNVTRVKHNLIIVNGASDEHLLNDFAYGANIGLNVLSGTANAFNLGTDNLGSNGYGILVASGTVKVMNYMRYNGTTSTGPVTIYNEMHL